MVITNSSVKILKLFLADPTQEYTIRNVSLKAKVNYRLVYQEIIKLEKEKIITIKKVGSSKVCKINLSSNVSLFSYIESLRKTSFQNKHAMVRVILNELNDLSTVYYSFLVFGSYAKGKHSKKSDLDLLFVISDSEDLNKFEQEVLSKLNLLSYKLDINVIKDESFLEMKSKQELNIVNEIIKNHIILDGAEQYYKLLSK